jgi:hypothetical protein
MQRLLRLAQLKQSGEMAEQRAFLRIAVPLRVQRSLIRQPVGAHAAEALD